MTGFVEAASLEVTGPSPGGRIGRELAIGDWTRDGAGDLFLVDGASVHGIYDRPALPQSIDLASESADFSSSPASESWLVGISRLATGDVNGDGLIDLIVSNSRAGGELGARPLAGMVQILLGTMPPAATWNMDVNLGDAVIHGAPTLDGAMFGDSLLVYDVNSDGLDDLLVGAPLANAFSPVTSSGEVQVVRGRAIIGGTRDLAIDPPDVVLHGESGADRFGTSVAVLEAADGPWLACGAPNALDIGSGTEHVGAVHLACQGPVVRRGFVPTVLDPLISCQGPLPLLDPDAVVGNGTTYFYCTDQERLLFVRRAGPTIRLANVP